MMVIGLTYNTAQHIIEVHTAGPLQLPALQELIQQIAGAVQAHACRRVLVDFREAEFQLSTMDIYDLPAQARALFSQQGMNIAGVRRALVVAHNSPDVHFLETVMLNAGQQVQAFTDLEAARQWLMEH